MQMVEPAACSSFSRFITASPLAESRFPVGSSASRMTGSPLNARAHRYALLLAARELRGVVLHPVRHPTRSSASCTRRLRSDDGMPRYVSGSSTFSYTVRSPIRLNA